MFFREKKSGGKRYLQLVENTRIDGKSKQRVLASFGRIDQLKESGQLEALIRSVTRFSEKMIVLTAHGKGETTTAATTRIGPPLIFERLWRETGCKSRIEELLEERKFGFNVERVIFMAVLNRLMRPGSDRQCDRWRKDYHIEGAEEISLHHYYRAMAWLGEILDEKQQDGATPFSPRVTKDLIEEGLFAKRRDLFTSLDLVFFDTTSIYFEGEGGETLGERGYSKDHRPDLKQMVVGAVLDNDGRPVCCELWPGSTADVKSLIPVVDRLRKRFSINRICIVAGLEQQLKKGEKSLVGNKGYRKYLKPRGKQGFEVDREKIKKEARFDGKWVLRTSLDDMPSDEVALKYKQLLTVESLFRSAKSLLETRPIHHKCDETIRGHVFCSFLALILMKELEDRLESKGYRLEWKDVIRDLEQLEEVTIEQDQKRFALRTQCKGVCGKVFQAAGVALPPTLRQLDKEMSDK